MLSSSRETVTLLLDAARNGDHAALHTLFPLVYDQLRVIAHNKRLDWQGDYTLNTTALVHEAYLKLADQSQIPWEGRAHFFGVAAKAMRHLLINYAQRQRAQKRGGDVKKISLEAFHTLLQEGDGPLTEERAELLTTLDEALTHLETVNERQSRIVECRFFGGMTVDETAAALSVSPRTVKRGWAMAQAWLFRYLAEQADA